MGFASGEEGHGELADSREAAAEVQQGRRTPLSKDPVVCLETGQSFNSLKEAAISIGRTYQCVSRAAKTGCATNGLHFYYADKTKPDKSFFVMTRDGADGRGGRGRKRPVVCLETSEQFESVSAATKLLNCDGRRLWMALNKGYSIHGLHYYYADKPRPDDSFFSINAVDIRKLGASSVLRLMRNSRA